LLIFFINYAEIGRYLLKKLLLDDVYVQKHVLERSPSVLPPEPLL
jgi:hypothetical protein